MKYPVKRLLPEMQWHRKEETTMSKKEKSTSVNKKTLGRILKYIKRYSFLVVLSLICAAISVVLTLYAPIITGHMVDKIVG